MPPAHPATPRSARPRAADVAALAGVSQSAVSRAFNDGSVSQHVRQRVLGAARQLGYRPNAMAQALPTRRSNVIAILMMPGTNTHYPEVLTALARSAGARSRRVMLFTAERLADVSAAVDQALSHQVDAVLALTDVPAPDAAALDAGGVALVLYNRPHAPYPATIVSCDHRSGGRQLGAHLLALGHRRFGIVTGPEASILSRERVGGILDALAEAGIPAREVAAAEGDYGYESGLAAAARLLDGRAPPTAIVAINDLMAIGAIDEAARRGLHAPTGLSVAGFDGTGPAAWERYRLTTVIQPLPQLADAALDAIASLLAVPGRARETRLLACALLVGASTGPCPPARENPGPLHLR